MLDSLHQSLDEAAAAVRRADVMLIGAGAGMGVDSGLPDFRGDDGFWKAYPAFRGKRFAEMSNPTWFSRDPELAWGFFGHRYNLYSQTVPHAGFGLLLKWAERMPLSPAIFTSNVDGQFQKAGFDEDHVVECHGSILHLQCAQQCTDEIWPGRDMALSVSEEVRLTSPLPRCSCGAVARPNILMFGDYAWISDRTRSQEMRYRDWKSHLDGRRVVIIEMGAGTAIPTVRFECEHSFDDLDDAMLIRINPRDPDVPQGAISLPLGALAALSEIDNRLE